MTHEHRFNGTLIRGMGRCACGAWARYKKKAYGPPLPEGPVTKGLETRLKNYRDPDVPYSPAALTMASRSSQGPLAETIRRDSEDE